MASEYRRPPYDEQYVTGASSAGTGQRRGRRSRTSNEGESESEGPDTGVGFAKRVQTAGATGNKC